MAQRTVTVTVTDEQFAQLNALLATSRQGSFQAVAQQCFDYGVDNRVYRQGYNRKKNAEAKADKQELETLRQKLDRLEKLAKEKSLEAAKK